MNTPLKAAALSVLMALAGSAMLAQQTSTTKRDPCAPLKRSDAPPGQLMHVVVGKPYSAVVEMQSTRTLEDGTRIERKGEEGHHYRDSAGRTRVEHTPLPPGRAFAQAYEGLISIEISDPVALKRYFLHPQNQAAQESDATDLAQRTVARTNSVQMRPAVPLDPDRPRLENSTEDLGTQTIDGLEVVGTKVTTTYPIGFEGNDRAFSSTRETWCSVDLQVIVLTKIDNPESGQSLIRLTNIDRTEPDPSLFQVPPDYTITPMATRTLGAPIQSDQHVVMPLPR